MMRFRLVILGTAILMLCLVAATGACTQEEETTPTTQATDASEAVPTLEPTDRSAPPPTMQPTDTPTPAPTMRPTDTPEAVPTPEMLDTPETTPTTLATDVPPECVGVYATSTPDPNVPEGIRNMGTHFWDVSSFEEAECIIGYPIAMPTNLPEGFIRGESVAVFQPGFRNAKRYVQTNWVDLNNPSIGFILEQNPNDSFLGDAEPAVINGVSGQRQVLEPVPSGREHRWLVLSWKQGEFRYTLTGPLVSPITEEFLLEVAPASVQLPEAGPTPQPISVLPECMALDPTNTPDPNRPEGILGKYYQFWNVSSFEEAECITGLSHCRSHKSA